MPRALPRALLTFVVVIEACGGSTPGPVDGGAVTQGGGTLPVDGGTDPDAGPVFPAPHPALPHVINFGGPVLNAPRIAPVFFSNDDPSTTSQIAAFLGAVGGSTYWTAATAEYGVGPASSLAPVTLAATPSGTMTFDAVASWLTGELNANNPQLGAPDGNTVYAINYPAGVSIQMPSGGTMMTSCSDFGGYHDSVTLDAAHRSSQIAYLVVPRCPSFNGLSGLPEITSAESHELVEASTDPRPMTTPAWAQVDDAHLYWETTIGGGEIGDLCAPDPQADAVFPGLPYTVQRIWSNQSAAAGHDPCVQIPAGEVYFNSAPELNDIVPLTISGQTFSTQGVKIPIGQSRTIALDLFSDGPTSGPWTVQVQGLSNSMVSTEFLSFSLDRTSGQNGDQLQLTITALKADAGSTSVFMVISTLGRLSHLWLGEVGN